MPNPSHAAQDPFYNLHAHQLQVETLTKALRRSAPPQREALLAQWKAAYIALGNIPTDGGVYGIVNFDWLRLSSISNQAAERRGPLLEQWIQEPSLRNTLHQSRQNAFFIHEEASWNGVSVFHLYYKSGQQTVIRKTQIVYDNDGLVAGADGRYHLRIPEGDARLPPPGWQQIAQRGYRTIGELAADLSQHTNSTDIAPLTPAPATASTHYEWQLNQLTEDLRSSRSTQRAALLQRWAAAYEAYDQLQGNEAAGGGNRPAAGEWAELAAIAHAREDRRAALLDAWVEKPQRLSQLESSAGRFFIHEQLGANGEVEFQLYHRSGSDRTVSTPISREADGLFHLRIPAGDSRNDKANWRTVTGQGYATLAALSVGLRDQHMLDVAPLAHAMANPPATHDRQIVVELEADSTVHNGAQVLYNKHASHSQIVSWEWTTREWRSHDGAPLLPLTANSRLIVAGHGGRNGRMSLQDSANTVGELSARELAARLAPLLPPGGIKTLVLIGCNSVTAEQIPRHADSGRLPQGFVRDLLRALPANSVGELHVHVGLVRVNHEGRKSSHFTAADGSIDTSNEKLIISKQADGRYHYRRITKAPPLDVGESGPIGRFDTPETSKPVSAASRTRVIAQQVFGASGTGMRLFGAYRTVKFAGQSLRDGNYLDASIAITGFTANIGAEIGERALRGLGSNLLRSSVSTGKLLVRAAPLLNLITAPWDIYEAAVSFSQASRSEGKVRQDALVRGGFALTGLLSTIGISAMALAGGSATVAAGPVGLAVGIGLIVASQTYAAVRQVEEIERWIPLSFWDKVRLGGNAFIGRDVDVGTQLQVLGAQHAPELNRQWLQHAEQQVHERGLALMLSPKTTVAGRVYRLDKTLASTHVQKHTQDELAAPETHAHQHIQLGQQSEKHDSITGPLDFSTQTVTQHYELFIEDSDDEFDFSQGVAALSDAQKAQLNIARAATRKTGPAHLDFGNGNDVITAVRGTANSIRLGSGSKTVVGGEHDDVFYLDATPDFGNDNAEHYSASRQAQAKRIGDYRYRFNGGNGQDTLILATDFTHTGYAGYEIDLQRKQFSLIHAESTETNAVATSIGRIENIEHIQSNPNARHVSRNRLSGDANANQLSGRSHDRLAGREGNDIYHVSLSQADDHVTIVDSNAAHDGTANWTAEWSLVRLDVPLSALADWSVKGEDLCLSAKNGATLTMKDVYRAGTSSSALKNDRFQFITHDGVQLSLNLPQTLAAGQDLSTLTIDAVYLPMADRTVTTGAQGMTVDLATATITRAGSPAQQLGAPYRLVASDGTMHDDVFIGAGANERFTASGGHDRFEGHGGEDLFFIDDSAGQADIDTGKADQSLASQSAIVLTHARLHQLTLQRTDNDLLIHTPNGKTVRHLDSANAAPLIVIDQDQAELYWQLEPDGTGMESVVQKAAPEGSLLRSFGARFNVLAGAGGDDQLDAQDGGSLLCGADGVDTYTTSTHSGHIMIDNQASDGQEDRLVWLSFDGGKKALSATRLGQHLVLGNEDGSATVTLVDYYRSQETRHLAVSLDSADGNSSEEVTAAELETLANNAEVVDTGAFDAQLQRLIEASSRFSAPASAVLASALPSPPAYSMPALASAA